MKTINEYADILINAKRYNIMNEYLSNSRLVYHLSEASLDGAELKPSIPHWLQNKDVQHRIDSGELKSYEDYKTPRVCFSPNIEACIAAMYPLGDPDFNYSKLKGKELYVNIPENSISSYKTYTNKYIIDNKLVWDARYTKELWVLEPVKLKCIGKIKITDIDLNCNSFKEYPYKFKWINKIEESEDYSKLDVDFKKKNDYSFKVITLNEAISKGYVDPRWKDPHKEGAVEMCTTTGDVSGYIYVNKKGIIGPLRVFDKFKGYGASEPLMKYAIDKLGACKLGVYTDNEVAIKLYKKFGFVETGREDRKSGEIIIMELKK